MLLGSSMNDLGLVTPLKNCEFIRTAICRASIACKRRLIYRGMTLEDDRTLDSYGLQEYHAIHMEIPNNPWFAEPETAPTSDTTTGGHGLPIEEMIMIDMICSNGNMFSVRSSVGSKVVDFKKLLAEISRIPPNEQRLIYRGKTLEDDRTLDSYGLKEYHTIHMDVAKNRPTGGMPDMSLLYPAIFQITQTLLSSPQLREQIIGQNPQLRSMFDSNPELRVMIQNPEVVRCLTSPQMMQAPESQLELPRQNLIRHSISSDDSAAGPSESKNAMGLQPQRSSDMKYPLCGGVFLAASMLAWRVCKSIS
ncbi:ubiquitin domain-containing protein DSK2a-like protein [Tanacetum coccineum]